MENKKYCIYCGSENDSTSKTCCHCDKELNPTENLLKEYLLNRTKDKLKGNIEDNLYNTIKNFLLSHLYGSLITVSIVSYVAVASGVDVIGKINNSHIEMVDYDPTTIIVDNNDNTDETYIVQTVVEEYVGYFKDFDANQNKIKAMEADSSIYTTNFAYDFDSIKDPYMEYTLQCLKPMINLDNPQGSIAQNLQMNNQEYAQAYLEVLTSDNEFLGTYLFTLVKDNENWYIVEADKIGEIEIISMEDYAYNAANDYRSYAYFPNYESYNEQNYQEFISHRLPDSYGYATSFEMGMDRFMEGASGCLNYSLVSSGISPTNYQSNIGSKLLNDNILFVEFTLTEDSHGSQGLMGERKWLIVTGYFDGEWYIIEDRFLGEERID